MRRRTRSESRTPTETRIVSARAARTGRWLSLPLTATLLVVIAVALPATAWAGSFTVRDSATNGTVTAHNAVVKIVWGYRPASSAYRNRSGGSVYGLWDLRTDPSCRRNLVQTVKWGSGTSTPSHAGVGGLGATKAYVNYSPLAITEIGTGARLLGHSVTQDAGGTLRTWFKYEVRDRKDVPQYELTKRWAVGPGGKITLRVTWTWLLTTTVDDPNYNFAVSRNAGWRRAGWLTHDWTQCRGAGSNGLANPHNHWVFDTKLATEGDRDYGTRHMQRFRFSRAAAAPALTISIEPRSGGYESSGLFRLGYRTWLPVRPSDALQQITGEFSNYRNSAYGHEVRWGSWFSDDGGRLTDTGPSRYRTLATGATWTDRFTITLSH
jgi:hypothetical protein